VITAIVLVHVAADRIPEAAQAIADLDGVDEVYSCAGDVDLIAMVKVAQHEQLADVIAGGSARSTVVRSTDTHNRLPLVVTGRTPRRPSTSGSTPDGRPAARGATVLKPAAAPRSRTDTSTQRVSICSPAPESTARSARSSAAAKAACTSVGGPAATPSNATSAPAA
jgi:hypothetical protein